jgi:hypothetical protein
MGAPPKARDGRAGTIAGRPVVAGIAPFARVLSPRATQSDLWASVEALAVEGLGTDRLEATHGMALDQGARKRVAAFIAQAHAYYTALPDLPVVAKPLVGYYFALNLTKAYLTVVDPSITEPAKFMHGLTSDVRVKKRYWFNHEFVQIKAGGAFRHLAENTAQGHWHKNNYEIALVEILPYLLDGTDLFADAEGKPANLLPAESATVLFGKTDGNNQGWLRIEVDRDLLRQRNLSPERLPKAAAAFGSRFRLVQDAARSTASYESIKSFPYGKKRSEISKALCSEFDASIVGVRRFMGGQPFITLSERKDLLSHEAVTFLVLFHLSNMVRYRPHRIEALKGTKYYWLLSSWVDRACENFLLSMASRFTNEEHLIG